MCRPGGRILHPFNEKMLTEVISLEQSIQAFLGNVQFTAKPFGSGHINSTYKVTTKDGKSYVLQ